MAIFQVPQQENAMGLNLGSLLQLAMQSQNNQNTNNSASQRAMQSYGMQSSLAAQRNNYAMGRQKNANDIARKWNEDQSIATIDSARVMFPGAMPSATELPNEIVRFLDPATAKTFTTQRMSVVPDLIRKNALAAEALKGTASEGMLPQVIGTVDSGVGNMYGYNSTNNNYDPQKPPAVTASTGYNPIPQVQPTVPQSETQIPEGELPGARYGSGTVTANASVPRTTGNTVYQNGEKVILPSGYKPVSAADEAKNAAGQGVANTSTGTPGQTPVNSGITSAQAASSPVYGQRKIDNYNRSNTLSNLDTASNLEAISGKNSGGQFKGLDGQQMKYSDGTPIPNGLPVDAATKQYAALLRQTSNPNLSAKAEADIAEWDGVVANTSAALQQSAGTFDNIRRVMSNNPVLAKSVAGALKGVKAQYDSEYSKYELASRQDPGNASVYAQRFGENVKRGLTASLGSLPRTPEAAELVSSLGVVTNLMTLEFARAIQEKGPVSNMDALAIKGSLGDAFDDPYTMFNKQSKVFHTLASRAAAKVYATRDPFWINSFNDVYKANVGVNFDPRGQLFRGIGNSAIQSTMQDATSTSTAGTGAGYALPGYSNPAMLQRSTSIKARLNRL